MLWCANGLEDPRFGLAVSRQVGNAVARNRVKRWLREAIRHERSGLPLVDVVIVARPSAATAGYEGLRASVRRAFHRICSEAT